MKVATWNKHLEKQRDRRVVCELAQYRMMMAIALSPTKAKKIVFEHYKNNCEVAMPTCKRKFSFDGEQFLQFQHSVDKDTRTGLPKKVRLVDDSTDRILFHYEAADERDGTLAKSVFCYPNNTAIEFHPETIVWPNLKGSEACFLPLDCLALIFSFLTPESLLRCRLVNTMWCAVASDDSVWKKHILALAPLPEYDTVALFRHYVKGTFRNMRDKERLASFLSSPRGESYFVHMVQTNTGTKDAPIRITRGGGNWRIRIQWPRFAYGIEVGNTNILTTTLIPYDILSWIRCYLGNIKNE